MQYQKESKNEKKKKQKECMQNKQRHKTNIYWSEMPSLPSPPSSLQY